MSKVGRDEAGLKTLLMGNEAIARGAVEAGIEVAIGYPGTPSTEVGEVLGELAPELGFYAEWSLNEKVAIDVASGSALTRRPDSGGDEERRPERGHGYLCHPSL